MREKIKLMLHHPPAMTTDMTGPSYNTPVPPVINPEAVEDFYVPPQVAHTLVSGISGLKFPTVNQEYNYYYYQKLIDSEQTMAVRPWHDALSRLKCLLTSLYWDEVFSEHNRWRVSDILALVSQTTELESLPRAWEMQANWYVGLVDRKRVRQQVCSGLLAILGRTSAGAAGGALTAAFLGGVTVPVGLAAGAVSGTLTGVLELGMPEVFRRYRASKFRKRLFLQTTAVDDAALVYPHAHNAKKWQGYAIEFCLLMGKSSDPADVLGDAARAIYFEPFQSKNLNLRDIQFPELNTLIIERMSVADFDNIDRFWNASVHHPMRDFLYFHYGLFTHLEAYRKTLHIQDPASRLDESYEESMYATRFYCLSRSFYMSSFFNNFIPALDKFTQKMLFSFDAEQSKATINLRSYTQSLMSRLQGPPTLRSSAQSLSETKALMVIATIHALRENEITDDRSLNVLCTVFQKIFFNTTFPTDSKLRELIDQYPHIVNPIIIKYAKKVKEFLDNSLGEGGKITHIFVYNWFVDFAWVYSGSSLGGKILMAPCAEFVERLCEDHFKEASAVFISIFVTNKVFYDTLNSIIKSSIGALRVGGWIAQLAMGHMLLPAVAGVGGAAIAALDIALFSSPLNFLIGDLCVWLRHKYLKKMDVKLLADVNKIITLDSNRKIKYLKPRAAFTKAERKLIYIEFGHFVYDQMRALESPLKKTFSLRMKLDNFSWHNTIEQHHFFQHARDEYQKIIKYFVNCYLDYLKNIYHIQDVLKYCHLYGALVKGLYDDYKSIAGQTHFQIGQNVLQLLAFYNKYPSYFNEREVDMIMQLNILYNGIS